jgi:hypothetical protein
MAAFCMVAGMTAEARLHEEEIEADQHRDGDHHH